MGKSIFDPMEVDAMKKSISLGNGYNVPEQKSIPKMPDVKPQKAEPIRFTSNVKEAPPRKHIVDVTVHIAPTVDAVPVVRCMYCKNRHTKDCAMYFDGLYSGEQCSWETDDDFCSLGEK